MINLTRANLLFATGFAAIDVFLSTAATRSANIKEYQQDLHDVFYLICPSVRLSCTLAAPSHPCVVGAESQATFGVNYQIESGMCCRGADLKETSDDNANI